MVKKDLKIKGLSSIESSESQSDPSEKTIEQSEENLTDISVRMMIQMMATQQQFVRLIL